MKRGKRSTVTLADVAALAGVSLATASRVINGSERTVGEPHRTKVLEAAQKLDYTPNAQAQAMARGSSNLMGLIVQDITDPYFSTIADGVTRVADQHGLIVLLTSTHHDADRELELIATLRAQRVRAIVLVGSRRNDRRRQELARQEIQTFRTGGGRLACVSQDRLGTDTVSPRNRQGAQALARALADLGHERFAILAGPSGLLTSQDRVHGFRRGLKDAGVPEAAVTVLRDQFTRDGGYAAAQRMVEGGMEGSCVFAVNDVMAVGAMAAFREAGLGIPEDVSVAGFDDIETLRDVAPTLTTVRLPLREMGQWAAEMALRDPDEDSLVDHVDGEVVLRASTGVVAAPTELPAI